TGGGNDIRLWDMPPAADLTALGGKELKCRATLKPDQVWITALSFSPDGKLLAAGGGFDMTTTLWDTATLEKRATLPGNLLAFSSDSKTLATARGKESLL